MVLRATLTTVPSSIAIPDPSTAAAMTQRPAVVEYSIVPAVTPVTLRRATDGAAAASGTRPKGCPLVELRTSPEVDPGVRHGEIGCMTGTGPGLPFGIDFGGSGIKAAPVDLASG